MVVPKAYTVLREKLSFDVVEYGWSSVRLVRPNEIPSAQIGFSVNRAGEKLDSDWNENWMVIGNDELEGDPLFVDIADELFPVFTAAHGEGNWEPKMVAGSFRDFIYFLGLVKEVAKSRDCPVALERSPLPKADLERILGEITETGVFGDYWSAWLNPGADADDSPDGD